MKYVDSKASNQLAEEVDNEFPIRKYAGKATLIVSIIAIIWSLFQLFAAGTGGLDAITLRGWHVLFLLVMVFLLYPARKKPEESLHSPPIIDMIFILMSISALGYLLLNYKDIVLRGGNLFTIDYVFGALGILMIFEAARRVVGNLAILAAIFLLYNFFGHAVPGAFGHS